MQQSLLLHFCIGLHFPVSNKQNNSLTIDTAKVKRGGKWSKQNTEMKLVKKILIIIIITLKKDPNCQNSNIKYHYAENNF